MYYSIHIPAPRNEVFQTVIGKETYPQWTEEFGPGSDVQGEWKQGETLRFTAPNANGSFDGMLSEVAQMRENEYIALHHMGMLRDGKEVTVGEESMLWKDAHEIYTFTESDHGTLFEVEVDIEEQWEDFFNDAWARALKRLQEVVIHGQSSSVTVQTWIKAPIQKVWELYIKPEHMTGWNFASDDWECPSATVDLRVGGNFSARMQAKDGSFGFDFAATYTQVMEPTSLSYVMEDNRAVDINVQSDEAHVHMTIRFDIEKENPRSMQRDGWQAILNNFKVYVERSL